VPSVLILSTTTGYQIRAFSDAARALGIDLVFASDRCDQLDDPWWDQAIPVRFHREDEGVAAVVASTHGKPLAGIVAVGDRPVALAARVASALALPGNPVEAARTSRDKHASRRALQTAGLPVPDFRVVPLDADAGPAAAAIGFPLVIKPLALSGSRGVMRVDDQDSFARGFDRLRRLLVSSDVQSERDSLHGQALLESFIPGREYAVEGLLTDGRFTALTIFDKPDPLDGPFFEETIYVTPSGAAARTQRAIVDAVAAAAAAIGLRHGPVHAEARVRGHGVFVLEVAARPIGGLCSKALAFDSPHGKQQSLEALLLRHAVGEDVSGWRRESRASGVMMIPVPEAGVYKGVEGVDAAGAVDGVDEVHITAKADTVLVPLPEGRSYLGFIFARGETASDVERSLRAAHARLRFSVQRHLDVVPGTGGPPAAPGAG
jgi:hypothetical protein